MPFFSSYYLIPTLFFLLVFGALFFLLEILMVIFLDHLEKRYWEWMVDVLIYHEVHHRFLFGIVGWILISLTVLSLFFATPLIEIYEEFPQMIPFAVGLFIIMGIIYFMNAYSRRNLAIQRKIYSLLFLAISVGIYGSVLSVAKEQFPVYVQYFHQSVLNPTQKQVESLRESRKRQKMLGFFRQDYLNQKCKRVDYLKQDRSEVITQLVWIADEPSKISYDDGRAKKILRGYECKRDNEVFLLSENNKWYWVSEVSYR